MFIIVEGRMGSGKTLTTTTLVVLDFIETGRRVIANYRVDLERVNDEGFVREVIMPKWLISDSTRGELGEVPACHDISAKNKFSAMHPEFDVRNLTAVQVAEENSPPYSFQYLNYETFVKDMEENKEFYGISFAIDEAYLWADSRLSQTAYSRLLSYFVFQSRKRDVDLYVTTQQFENIDVRMRRNAEIRVLARTNKETKQTTARFLDLRTGQRKRIKIFGPEIYKFYNTLEIPPLQQMHTRNLTSGPI